MARLLVENFDAVVGGNCFVRADRDNWDVRQLGHARTVWRIEAYHRAIGASICEETQLGLEIGFHVAIVVEMIVAQVGEGRHIKVNTVYPKLCEGLRRNFENRRGDTLFFHSREQGVHLGDFGSRESTHNNFAGYVAFGRRGKSGDLTKLTKHGLK